MGNPDVFNKERLVQLFRELEAEGYCFSHQNPNKLVKLRKNPGEISGLCKFLGLGIPVSREEISSLSDSTLAWLSSYQNSCFISKFAITGESPDYQIHDHWPPPKETADYVHVGSESFYIRRELEKQPLQNKLVLDLGCGQGVLGLKAAELGAKVLGLDCSLRSISLANKLSEFYSLNCEFKVAAVGDKQALSLVREFQQGKSLDLIVFNPPLVVSDPLHKTTYRDGGKFGTEVLFLFLDFVKTIENFNVIWFLCGDPQIHGNRQVFHYLKQNGFKILERRILQDNFNQEINSDKMIKNIQLVLYKVVKS